MTEDKREIQELLIKHLGPIEPIQPETEDKIIRLIIDVSYPNGKNIYETLSDAGINISQRQVKPYKDALILGRIKGWNGQELFDYIKKEVVFCLGTKVTLL